jgi:hypothetical protein
MWCKTGFAVIVVLILCLTFSNTYAQVPNIVVTPDSLIDTLSTGGTSTHWLTVANTGNSDLTFYAFVEGMEEDYALQFNGLDGCLCVGNSPSLNNQYTLTLEAWVYALDWHSRRILQKGYDDNQYMFSGDFTDIHMSMQFAEGSRFCVLGPAPSTYQWHHVAGVYDGNNGTGYLYVDGQLVAQVADNGTIAETSDPLYIGTKHEWAPPTDFFMGFIDEIRIWNTARTQAQIQECMHNPLTGSEPGLAAYWRFNEGTGLMAYDGSPNSNSGTLLGGVTWCDYTPPLISNWLAATPLFGIVPPDSSMQLEVTFDAADLWGWNYESEIVVISNDPDEPEIIVPAYLHVLGTPDIDIIDTLLDFGVVTVGTSTADTIIISNVGDAWLLVTDISSDNTDYSVGATTFNVAPDCSYNAAVTFAPSAPGVSIGTLSITSDDPDEPVVTIDLIGAGMTGVTEGEVELPKSFSLSGGYPNPFSRHTVIDFACPHPSEVSLRIYDLTGRLVKILCDEEIGAGSYSFQWNGKSNSGKELSTGVYIMKLDVGEYTATRKLLLIR